MSQTFFKTQFEISSGPLEHDVLISRSFLAIVESDTIIGD